MMEPMINLSLVFLPGARAFSRTLAPSSLLQTSVRQNPSGEDISRRASSSEIPTAFRQSSAHLCMYGAQFLSSTKRKLSSPRAAANLTHDLASSIESPNVERESTLFSPYDTTSCMM